MLKGIQIIQKNKNLIIYSILTVFFIVQIRYIFIGGTTYDADGLRFGSNIILEKILRIFSYNTDFSDLPYTGVEYYGMIVILPAYIFSQLLVKFIKDPSILGFESLDGIIYLLMNLYFRLFIDNF